MVESVTSATATGGGTRGRPLDPSREAALLDATLDLLRERGYGGFTVAEVAGLAKASKATVYRRWNTKAELVVAALLRLRSAAPALPDTGTLRGDLTALVDRMSAGVAELGGLVNVLVGQLPHDPELARAFRDGFLAKRMALIDEVFARSASRGEIPASRATGLLREVIPAHLVYRMIMLGQPPDPGVVARLIDEVILPAATAP